MDGIGLRIKKLRKNFKLNQIEFSKRVGVTNAHISAIEKGKTVPSSALIKLISKEFNVSEDWLTYGTDSDAIETLELEYEMEDRICDIVSRMNHIRTRDNTPIRSRVVQLEDLFVNILDFGLEEDAVKESYYDICYKLFYHINSYVSFHKQALEQQQPHIFPFPDDLIEILKKDIQEFESFFNKELGLE